MKKVVAVLIGACLAVLVGVVCVKTLRAGSRQMHVEPVAGVAVDEIAAAERLAGAVRYRTISHEDPADFDGEEFVRFHEYLAQTFPNVHSNLERETVSGYSLLYRWPGSDTSLAPVILTAHIDVVPVEPGTEDDWTYGAFEGLIEEGYVWGRGSMDDKGMLLGLLESVELMLGQGAEPRRTVYLAFGHDEEVGGPNGAVQIAALLASRGIDAEYVLDEGGAVADGLVPGVPGAVALVGIAEKGFLSLELAVDMQGGHSSMPPAETAIGVLSAAVQRVERRQMPLGIKGGVAAMFDYLGPEMPFAQRAFLANRWLFSGLIERLFARSAEGNAMLRTTTAPTIFQAGMKANVLPSSARAVVNFRILPGDSVADVIDHARRAVDDPRVDIRTVGAVSEPSPVSDVESESFLVLSRTIREIFPGAIVAPWVLVGGSDARHYAGVSRNVLRFGGARVGAEDIGRVHGTDERVSVGAHAQAIRFFVQLLLNSVM